MCVPSIGLQKSVPTLYESCIVVPSSFLSLSQKAMILSMARIPQFGCCFVGFMYQKTIKKPPRQDPLGGAGGMS